MADLFGDGVWQNATSGDRVVDKVEYSWLFTRRASSMSSEVWLAAGVAIAEQYQQEAFVIGIDGSASICRLDGSINQSLLNSDPVAISSAWEDLAQLRGGASHGYSVQRQPCGFCSDEMTVAVASTGQPATLDQRSELKTSSYVFPGPGLLAKPEFRMAEPGNIASSMMFANIGAHRIFTQGIP